MLNGLPSWAIGALLPLIIIAFSLKILRAKMRWEIVKSKQYSKGQLLSGRAVYGQILGYDAPISDEQSYRTTLLISRIASIIAIIGLIAILIFTTI